MIKYKIADNAMAKLALPLTETSTTMTIKEAVNIPTEGIWIATLVGYEGEKATKMEKVRVNSRSGDVLTIERGFESHPLQWEADTPIFLNVTAEVIRDIQDAIEQIGDTNNLLKKTNNLSDLQDKAQARTNLGAESERNKKQSIESNKTSNIFYPTIKAVYDWVIGLLTKKADLIDGKVPSSQLPEVSQIDESNLVHKSGDETIGGIKKLTNIIKKSLNQKIDNYDEETAGVSYRQERGGGYKRWLDFFAHGGQNQIVGGSGFRFLGNRPGSNALDVIMALVHGHLTFNGTITSQHFNTKQDGKTNRINIWKEGELNRIDSSNDSSGFVDLNIRAKKLNFEGSSIVSNGQDWTGEWKEFTPTISGEGGNPGSYTVQKGRYKVIGKTCLGWLKVEGDKGNLIGRPYISLPTASKREWEGIGAQSIIGALGTNTKNTFGYASINTGKVEILGGIGHAGNRSQIPQKYWILVKFFYETE